MAYEIETVTEGNVDTPLTVFPTSVDTFPRMSDVSITTLPLVLQYNAYYQSGNLTAANQLVLDNPELAYCMFTAKGHNEIRDAIIAMEYFLLNQVDELYNNVAQNAIGINDNPTEEQSSITTYSAEKIDSVFDATNEKIDSIIKVSYITLPLAGWTKEPPYTQTIEMADMKAEYSPIIGVCLDKIESETIKKQIQKSWNFVDSIKINDGQIIATCKFKKPINDIPLVIKGI